MPEVKLNFSPRFAIKLDKYVYRSKLQPVICNSGTKFIQIKIRIRSYCYVNNGSYCKFLNFNI